MSAPSYHRVASLGAFGAGVCGFLYSAAFVIVARSSPSLGAGASALLLVVGGLLGIVAILGLAGRLRQSGEYALLALLLGLGGSLAAILHGGYDLANAIHPPPGQPSDLPSQVDPRGLGTFGLPRAAILLFAWLAGRGRA